MLIRKILSTGILRKEPGTDWAFVTILNLDDGARDVTVEVWDWSFHDTPLKLPVVTENKVISNWPIEVYPNHGIEVYSDISNGAITLYEIRIFHPGDRDVVVNCFGRGSAPGYAAQNGNTVFQKELVEVRIR